MDRFLKPLGEFHLWFPAKDPFGILVRKAGTVNISGADRAVENRDVFARQADHFLCQIIHGNFRFRAHVAGGFIAMGECSHIGADHIVDIDEIPRLSAVAKDSERFVFRKQLGEDIDDAAFTVSALTRAVNVAVTKNGVV